MSDPEQSPEIGSGADAEASGQDARHDAGATEEASPATWRDLHLWQIQPVRDILAIVAVLALLRLGYHLRLVTIPLLLAMALAYLFEPLVRRLVSYERINRRMAAAGIVVAAGLLIVVPMVLGAGFATVQGVTYARTLADNVELLVESLENPESERLRAQLPNDAWIALRDWLMDQQDLEQSQQQRLGEEIRDRTSPEGTGDAEGAGQRDDAAPGSGESGADDAAAPDGQDQGAAPPDQPRTVTQAAGEAVASSIEQRTAVGEFANFLLTWVKTNAEAIASRALRTGQGAVSAAISGLTRIGSVVFMGFLTAFFFFFISTGWGKVVEFWEGLIPERRKGRVIELVRMMDAVISGFVRGRLIIAFILAVFFTIAYWLIGMPMPLILGPAVGIISIVPYVALISLPVTIGAMLLDPNPVFAFQSATWWAIVAPILVYQAGQLADDYLLTPAIQGKTTDMDTPTILFASIAGGVLAGIYGLLLAIPAAACIKILLREVFWPQFREWAQGERSDFLPIGRE